MKYKYMRIHTVNDCAQQNYSGNHISQNICFEVKDDSIFFLISAGLQAKVYYIKLSDLCYLQCHIKMKCDYRLNPMSSQPVQTLHCIHMFPHSCSSHYYCKIMGHDRQNQDTPHLFSILIRLDNCFQLEKEKQAFTQISDERNSSTIF